MATETRRPRALVNGFGRIGRLAMRRAFGAGGAAPPPFDIVAVNDPSAVESSAYLFQFDSVQGRFGETNVAENGEGFAVAVGGGAATDIAYTRFTDPSKVGLGGGGGGVVGGCGVRTGRLHTPSLAW